MNNEYKFPIQKISRNPLQQYSTHFNIFKHQALQGSQEIPRTYVEDINQKDFTNLKNSNTTQSLK